MEGEPLLSLPWQGFCHRYVKQELIPLAYPLHAESEQGMLCSLVGLEQPASYRCCASKTKATLTLQHCITNNQLPSSAKQGCEASSPQSSRQQTGTCIICSGLLRSRQISEVYSWPPYTSIPNVIYIYIYVYKYIYQGYPRLRWLSPQRSRCARHISPSSHDQGK